MRYANKTEDSSEVAMIAICLPRFDETDKHALIGFVRKNKAILSRSAPVICKVLMWRRSRL